MGVHIRRDEVLRFISATGPRLPRRQIHSTEAHDAPYTPDQVTPRIIPQSKRWAPVSGSANAEMDYKWATRDPKAAYAFVCMCRPPFRLQDDDPEPEWDGREFDDDESNDGGEDDENKDENEPDEYGCDRGKTCLCDKPASEHPDHIWKLSAAGKHKLFTQRIHYQVRCPRYFGSLSFKYHIEYGVLEMLQNLVLDFEEADGNYKEQWAVCEALALFLQTDICETMPYMGELDVVEATYELVCRLFLSMLAQLERKNLLFNESEIENLGLMIPLFMVFAGRGESGEAEDSEPEDSEPEDSEPEDSAPEDGDSGTDKDKPPGPASDIGQWNPDALDSLVLAYARKYDIHLVGDTNLEKIIRNAKSEVKLPDPESSTGEDPWGFRSCLEKYKIEHRGIMATMAVNFPSLTPVGGDNLDMTTWSSTKRRAASPGQMSDPLTKAQVDALKKGMVLSFIEVVPERGWDVAVSALITTQGRVVSKELL